MEAQELIERLTPNLSSNYEWPEIPGGWRLEFIVYPEGEIDMDLLHPVSGRFWSEDNDFLPMPIMKSGKPISLADLKMAGVPVMNTFGHAFVNDNKDQPHLSLISS